MLESVSSDSDSGTRDFFGLTTDAPIRRIEITLNPDPGGWGYDDLIVGSLPAQAPTLPGASLAALAGGLAIAFVALRRRAR